MSPATRRVALPINRKFIAVPLMGVVCVLSGGVSPLTGDALHPYMADAEGNCWHWGHAGERLIGVSIQRQEESSRQKGRTCVEIAMMTGNTHHMVGKRALGG